MSPAEALRGGWCVVRQENLWLWSERSVQMAHIRAALLDGSGLASRVTLVIMPKARHHAPLWHHSAPPGERLDLVATHTLALGLARSGSARQATANTRAATDQRRSARSFRHGGSP